MTTTPRRLFSLFSLLAFSALLLGYLWWGKFRYDHNLLLLGAYVGGLAILVVNHLVHRDSLKQMGIRADNLRQASAWYGGLTLALGAGVLATGLWIGEPRLDRWSDVYVYAIWAALQQHLLQNFLRLRSQELLGGRRDAAALLAAALFGLYHLPNVPLMAASFVGALAWCLLFARVPNLFWAALSQALLSVCLMVFFKFGFLNQFGVGKTGFRYDCYGAGVNVAGGHDAAGRPFVAAAPGPDRGVKSRIRTFEIDGTLRAEWIAFDGLDYSSQIAVGDLGFAPGDEVVVAPGPGPHNPPLVRVFDPDGKLLREIAPPLPDTGYGAWVSVGAGRLCVTPGPAPGGPSLVLELDPKGRVLSRRRFDLEFENGIRAVPLNRKSPTAADSSALLLWAPPAPVNPSRVFTSSGTSGTLTSFDAFQTTFGVSLAPLWLAPDKLGIVMAPGPLRGHPSSILITDLSGAVVNHWYVTADPDSYGANVAALDTDADGVDEVLTGEGVGPGRPYTIRLFRQDGTLLRHWEAF